MGVSYECLVFPAAGHVSYAPHAEVVGRIVDGLIHGGWLEEGSAARLDAQAEGKRPRELKIKSKTASGIASQVAKLSAESYVLRFDNDRDEGDPTPFEEDESGVFRPAYCESAYLGVSAHPFLIGDRGYPEDTVACPRCKQNAVLLRHDNEKISGAGLLMVGRSLLPAKCPHCRAALDPEKLTMKLHVACDRKTPAQEKAPFFRFSLWMLAVDSRAPALEKIKLDPSLPALLKKVCGVPFRSYAKMGWS